MHMKVAYGEEIARHCSAEGWTTVESKQISRSYKHVEEILTMHPHFNCFPEEGEILLSAIIRWIYVLTIETAMGSDANKWSLVVKN